MTVCKIAGCPYCVEHLCMSFTRLINEQGVCNTVVRPPAQDEFEKIKNESKILYDRIVWIPHEDKEKVEELINETKEEPANE